MTQQFPLVSEPSSPPIAEQALVAPESEPESGPKGRLELDTVAAVSASLVGATSVLVAAVGLIELCVAPLGVVPVIVAAVGSGVLVTTLLAGAVWVWRVDRSGRAA
ncbi:hypothetical protein [Leifsonia sp. 2MCAF36]|uniref:hypothetical protein n=1 Tax=Leifsonia sp. 2MCAF36 TaxID=3232988 RepID=UPI003F9CFB99